MKNIFLAFTFLAIANSSNAFEVNLDDRGIADFTSKVVLSDLLVGDSMRIDGNNTCVQDGDLQVYGLSRPEEKSDYSVTFVATRKPGGQLSLKTELPEYAIRSTTAITLMDCALISSVRGNSQQNFFSVSDIDGFSDLRSLYASDLYQMLPFK